MGGRFEVVLHRDAARVAEVPCGGASPPVRGPVWFPSGPKVGTIPAMSRTMSLIAGVGCLVVGIGGCAEPAEGLARTADGDGPRVVFDFDNRPLPEIPFPNDIATRHDPSSPTGLRINASMVAPTELERTARERIDAMSGWGVFQPIAVRFDKPLDLDTILDRHRDYLVDDHDYDFFNDAVYLFDVTPGSPTYLQPVPLDFGDGNFPILLRTPSQYWEHDPKTATLALAYDTSDEDLNGNGVLDPGEDLDLDGNLDLPNLVAGNDGDPTLSPADDLTSFWENETNTLLFKPVLPLREKTRYAVVLTTRLRDTDGEPVRSPFDWVNHTAQTDDLAPVIDALDNYGIDPHEIAFTWTMTTADASTELVTLRNGLYGEGPLSWLAEDNAPALESLYPMQDEEDPQGNRPENVYILPQDKLAVVLGPLAGAAFGDLGLGDSVDTSLIERNHEFYDYHVSGTFLSPQLLDLQEGSLDERAWPVDITDPSLRERVKYEEVQFWCAVPRKEFWQDPTQPPPVVLYAHGYTSNKIEQLGLALHGKFGIASCGIDAPYHGLQVGDQEMIVRSLLTFFGMGPAADALLANRIRDVDGDGVGDLGSEFFTGYLFRTRDNLRQTLLDWLTLTQLIRSFGSGNMLDVNGDGVPELLGDFNADGQIDFGGPEADFFASGTSLGGLVSSMLAAVEPSVVAAAPISGGAGLIDLTIRSEQGGVVEAVALRMLGPLFVGEPASDGGTRLYTLFPNGNQDTRYDVARNMEIEPGDVVMASNLRTGEARCARVMPLEPPAGFEDYEGWSRASSCALNDAGHCRECAEGTAGSYACDLAGTFRVGVPADAGDPISLDVWQGPDSVIVFGDQRECIPKSDAKLRTSISEFSYPIQYRGFDIQAGDDLLALEDGYGFQRGTPSMRRFTGLAQMAVEPADPAVYAPHYARSPLIFREDGREFANAPTHVLNVTTVGDANVPVNTGVNIAKVAGVVEIYEPDSRYGKTVNRVLIDEGVIDGIPWRETRGEAWGPVLVDVDNISNSTNTTPMDPTGSVDGKLAPRLDPPLRLIVPTHGAVDGGKSGVVLPMINENSGAHGFSPPGLTNGDFDVGQFMEHQIGWFFLTRGTDVRFDPCLAEFDACSFIPKLPE